MRRLLSFLAPSIHQTPPQSPKGRLASRVGLPTVVSCIQGAYMACYGTKRVCAECRLLSIFTLLACWSMITAKIVPLGGNTYSCDNILTDAYGHVESENSNYANRAQMCWLIKPTGMDKVSCCTASSTATAGDLAEANSAHACCFTGVALIQRIQYRTISRHSLDFPW